MGCKSDLRPPADSQHAAGSFVSRAQAERVAQQIGARAHKECSALRTEGVDDVFEVATRLSMLMREGVPTHARAESGGGHSAPGGRRSGEAGRTGGGEHKSGCCVVC